jgi:lysozyme family protein
VDLDNLRNTMLTFDEAFTRLLGSEGGYTNNSADPGGETNWGISKRSYPHVDIKNLTRAGAQEIYMKDFWQPLTDASPAVRFQAFDFAVNSGIQTAVRKLQQAVSAADDGHWGPKSAAAMARIDQNDVLMKYLALRLRFMTDLTAWESFSKGWARRISQQLLYAAEDN